MKTKIYLSLFLFIIALPACNEEFLEEEPFDFLTTSNFYRNEADALSALTAAYYTLGRGQSLYGRHLVMLTELPGEVVLRGSGPSVLNNFTWNATTGDFFPVWSDSYTGINRANVVIERVPAIDMDPDLQARIVAEARFLRALHYFNLIRLFGNVPLVTKETPDELQPSNEGTADAVWQLIIEDLQHAEGVLPKKSEYSAQDLGRATQGAAKALLAEVYLQRSGLGVADEWAMAAAKAEEVMDAGEYSLFEEYSMNFDADFENGEEIIFSVQYEQIALKGSLNRPSGIAGTSPSNQEVFGWSTFVGEVDFFAGFPLDNRHEATWLLQYETEEGEIMSYPEGIDFPHTKKYQSPVNVGGSTNLDFKILRYADLLLMHSEAANESGSGDPYLGINMVRERAGLAPLSGLSQQTLREAIIQERAWELGFEGHTYFDYQRQGVLEAKNPEFNVQPFHYLFPIPQDEMDRNPNLVQNPGY